MNLSNTDTRMLLETLKQASRIISSNAKNTKEANVGRKCMVLFKKLKRKNDRLSTAESRSTGDSRFP